MINIIDSIKLPFRKEKELFSSLHKILGFYPHNIAIYKQALSHKSLALHTEGGQRINNERLEFLGDAIIEAVTSDIVFRHFEKGREGFLTTTRSKLVQRTMLNRISEEIGLDKLLRSSGRRSSHNCNIAGNAFEAIVGAVYLDRGYDYCMWFLKRRILRNLVNIDKVAKKEVNFKSKLLEWAQRNRLQLEFNSSEPSVKADESKSPSFVSIVSIEGVECGIGKGFSKKESHQNASRETLIMLNRTSTLIADILQAKERRTAMEAQLVSVPPKVEADEEKPAKTRHRGSASRRAPGSSEENSDKKPARRRPSAAKVRAARPPKVETDELKTETPAEKATAPAEGERAPQADTACHVKKTAEVAERTAPTESDIASGEDAPEAIAVKRRRRRRSSADASKSADGASSPAPRRRSAAKRGTKPADGEAMAAQDSEAKDRGTAEREPGERDMIVSQAEEQAYTAQ